MSKKTKEEFASSDALRWHNADIINFGYPKEEITWLTNESANLVDSIKFRKVDIINLVVTSDTLGPTGELTAMPWIHPLKYNLHLDRSKLLLSNEIVRLSTLAYISNNIIGF